MKIIVIGGGAWGTALAVSAAANVAAGHQVRLWLRDAAQAEVLQTQHVNPRYLPGVTLPPALQIGCSTPLAAAVQGFDLAVIASPMSALRGLLRQLADFDRPLVWLCKGFEASQPDAGADQTAGLLGHEIQAQVAPQLHTGVLSGPSFAIEVARAQPTALVAASQHAAVRAALVQAFHSASLRVYASTDPVGVEVGGAVKNVLAIATGLCDGLSLGLNARAALITRGLAEISRLGLALGGRFETFMGLSGLGDLVLTATGDLSRNRQIGLQLAQGTNLQQALTRLGHVAEGVYSARTVLQRARQAGVEMPIAACVVDLLEGRLDPQAALARLMAREPTREA